MTTVARNTNTAQIEFLQHLQTVGGNTWIQFRSYKHKKAASTVQYNQTDSKTQS